MPASSPSGSRLTRASPEITPAAQRSSSFFGRLVLRKSAKNLKDKDDAKRGKRKPQKLRKSALHRAAAPQDDIDELGERSYSVWSQASTLVGQRQRDHTDMIHGLAHHDSFDSLVDGSAALQRQGQGSGFDDLHFDIRDEDAEQRIANLPANVWTLVASFLAPADAAHLAIATKTLYAKLGQGPLLALSLPGNRHERVRFLNHLNHQLPNHLLCFPCGTYHRRTSFAPERLKADYVNNPIYTCPLVYSSYLPRTRLASGRELPYSFVQLATRHHVHGRFHGVDADSLCRRWKDVHSAWSHSTRYMVHDGKLLLRIRSQVYAQPRLSPTAERHLLYEREEYLPYFSVCAHWRDGELMDVCKCQLSHVPEGPQSYIDQLRKAPTLSKSLARPSFVVRGCDFCNPARRCPECPTEYLVEISMTEDKEDSVHRFKHALIVTRWSDLGDGSSPTASPEWSAINGVKPDYDSFTQVGRRAVAGIFESKISKCIPGQRMISLNPGNKRLGEDGHGWY